MGGPIKKWDCKKSIIGQMKNENFKSILERRKYFNINKY